MVTVIPLSSIIPYDDNFESIFLFFRDNLKVLQGSLLIAFFDEFWKDQNKKIRKFIFIPFVMYFLVANLYYT